MPQYKDAYLAEHYDRFVFFDPKCRDRRVREVNQRTKRCLTCPGLKRCRLHPEFWLQGEEERLSLNEAM